MRSTETKITGSTALGLVAPLELEKIVSGGQTGADRAALDFAIEHQIPHGGWCPAGRKAEDGMINSRYHLTETTSGAYSERTRKNVLGSDGTVIFTIEDKLRGGSRTTVEFAKMVGKPWLHLAAKRRTENVAILRYFIQQHGIRVLNIAGTRKSEEPTIGRFVASTLRRALPTTSSNDEVLCVLVVDDDEWLRSCYCVCLDGIRVVSAENSEQGLNAAKRQHFDLVITDVMRPGKLDGLQFTRAMRRAHPRTPIIIATGLPDAATKAQAFRSGAHVFLCKPFDKLQLLIAIDYALSNKRFGQ